MKDRLLKTAFARRKRVNKASPFSSPIDTPGTSFDAGIAFLDADFPFVATTLGKIVDFGCIQTEGRKT